MHEHRRHHWGNSFVLRESTSDITPGNIIMEGMGSMGSMGSFEDDGGLESSLKSCQSAAGQNGCRCLHLY